MMVAALKHFQKCLSVMMLGLCLYAGTAHAQKPPVDAEIAPPVAPTQSIPGMAMPNGLPDRIVRPMLVIDPTTLRAEGLEIHLWGIKAAQSSDTKFEIQAMDKLDKTINGQLVSCKIQGGTFPDVYGRCVTKANDDLGLTLLNAGLAIRDRRITYNTPFATAYGQAEEYARLNKQGIWNTVSQAPQTAADAQMPVTRTTMLLFIVIIPIIGLMVIGLIMWTWLQRISNSHRAEIERAMQKERMLISRERSVLVSTLESELMENKNKIDAFLTICRDMLADMLNPDTKPKYQTSGDIVQKHPGYSKTVFEASADRLSMLGIKVAGRLAKLYGAFPKEQEYINLEPHVPLDTAIKLIEKTIADTEVFVQPVNEALAALQAMAAAKSARMKAESEANMD